LIVVKNESDVSESRKIS